MLRDKITKSPVNMPKQQRFSRKADIFEEVRSTLLVLLFMLFLVSIVSSFVREVDSASVQATVETSIEQLNSTSKDERISAVKYLAGNRSERATEGLITALDNSDRDVKEIAVNSLVNRIGSGQIGKRAVEGLIHALDNSAASVRRSAVNGLSNAETERGTEGLIHALDSSDENVARFAVDALARRVRKSEISERAVEGLIHALDNEQFEVRKAAVLGLRDTNTDRARNGLKHALDDSDERIRQMAREALRQ